MKQPLTFPELLTAIFITLKLCGVIDWRWVWVLAPIWIVVLTDIGATVSDARNERREDE